MYILQKQGLLVIPRTELTYPAHTLKMHEKASQAPTDHVMPDFEDACPYEFKGDKSRGVMVEALNTLDWGNKVIAIRPNNIKSKYLPRRRAGDRPRCTGQVPRHHPAEDGDARGHRPPVPPARRTRSCRPDGRRTSRSKR